MRNIAHSFALGLAVATLAASSASACRLPWLPGDVTWRRYDAVIIVKTTDARSDGFPTHEAEAWHAVGAVAETVEGAADATAYQFHRSGSSAACDGGMPSPHVGDLWVLYLNRIDDRLVASRSYPLEQMLKIDPRLAGR